MSDSLEKCKILFLVDGRQGRCALKNEAKVLANRVTLSAFRILTALNDEVLCNKNAFKKRSKIPHLQWSYKMYNSSQYKLMRKVNEFKDFKNRYFEEFETEVEKNIETAIPDKHRDSDSKGNVSGKQYPAKVLNKVLNEIVLEYRWEDPDIFSPVKGRRRSAKNEQHCKTKNIVFLFAKCPKNPCELRQFSGKVVLDHDIFLDSFMPPDLIRTFLHNVRLSLYWIDTDVSYVDVIPESVKFVEAAIDKLHGSLIPAETLVQTNRKCVVNISSLPPFAQAATASCTSKNSTSLMGLVSYTSVITYHLQQSKLATLTNDYPRIQCNLSSNDNTPLCSFSISPLDIHLHSTQSQKKHRISNPKDIAHRQYLQLPQSGENIPLRVYGVLPLREAEFVQHKGHEDYVCSELHTDVEHDGPVPFLSLLRKLVASSQALIIVTEKTPGLFVLRPLTPDSATLSALYFGESLDIEKRLTYFKSSPEINMENVQDTPWDHLISRAVQHSSKWTKTSTPHKNRECFDPNVLGRTHLPGCRSGLVSLIEKLNNRISQLEFLNEDEVQSLRELQRIYRQENKPIRPRDTVLSQLQEREQLNGSKPELSYSDSLPSRGVLMVNKSRQSSVLRDANSSTATTHGKAQQDNKPEMTNIQAEFESEEEIVQYLIQSYSEMLLVGCENVYQSAQSLVMIPLHYLKDQQVEKPQERCVELLERGVICPVGSLRERHQREDNKTQKQTELQLQTVLRFEILSVLQQCDQSVTEEDDTLNGIITLLRTLSFIMDPKSLSDFMAHSLVDNYIHTLPQTLGSVYDELMQPLPVALEAILSPDNNADLSVFNKSLQGRETDNSVTSPSTSEVVPKSNDAPTSKPKAKRMMHHPSLSDIGSKRQIFVNTTKIKEKPSSRKRRKSKRDLVKQSKSKTKLERRQSVAVMETAKSPKGRKSAHSQLKSSKSRYLLSPPSKSSAKKTLVAETPSHKQKNSALWKRQEAKRRRTQSNTAVKVVEESPMKSERPSLLSPSQNKRALHKVRRSFYSASAGPLIRSRSMTQTNIDLAENIADKTHHSSGKLNSILRKPSSQSSIFKSPDRNSSFLLSQLMGSPTPQKPGFKTPGKTTTPRKVIAESPSINTRSKSPFISKGFSKALFQESPNGRNSQSKIVRHSPKQPFSWGKDDERSVKFSQTPKKSPCELGIESPSQNTRSKSLVTPTRKSVRAILFGKSPEAKAGDEKKDKKTPSKSSPRARRLILSKTPVKGQKASNLDQSADTEKHLTVKITDDEGNTGDISQTFVNDGNKDMDSKESPDKCGTPSPKIQRKIRTPSSLNHWQRRKRGRDESLQSPKLVAKRTDAKDAQNSCESVGSTETEVDNDIIFASLSQEDGHISCRKRGLGVTEDKSVIFSPSKRKRTMKHSDQGSFRTSYTLLNKITDDRNAVLNSFVSGNSEGFDTTDLTDSQSSYRLSQASTSSMDFSSTNDEVFCSQNQGHEKAATSVSDKDTNTGNACTSPGIKSGKKTRKMELSDIEGTSGQKVSPSEKKYSPNVTAKSLMHLMNSPLLSSDIVEKSPNVKKNTAIVRQQRPRSRRSLNLQM